jgi:hypothetical protein
MAAPGSSPSSAVRLSSVVSTFLVSFGVVVAAIAAVVHVVLNGPDQPATIRRQSFRDRPPSKPKRSKPMTVSAPASAPAPAATLVPAGPALALSDSDVMRLRVLPARTTTLWARIRSAVVLMVLVGILGALLALAVGALGLGLALLLRSATG